VQAFEAQFREGSVLCLREPRLGKCRHDAAWRRRSDMAEEIVVSAAPGLVGALTANLHAHVPLFSRLPGAVARDDPKLLALLTKWRGNTNGYGNQNLGKDRP
jgi:hypothetical protein